MTPFPDFSFICSHTKLTLWSRFLLEMLVNKFLEFYRIWRFVTAFTTGQSLVSILGQINSVRTFSRRRGVLVSQKWLRSAGFAVSTVKLFQKTRRLVSLRNEVRPTANADTVKRHGNCSLATEHVNHNVIMQYACPANYVMTDSSTWRPLTEAALAISCFRLGTDTALYIRSGRNTWRFGNTAVSGTVGVGNLSFSALLARLKAFQLPWSAGL